jgi:1-acyl-sn-glycerol-3-phosphate acyltransferase
MAAIHHTPGSNRAPILVRVVRITRLVLHLVHGLFIVRLRYPGLSEDERHEVKRLWFGKTLSILSISIRKQDATRDLPERCMLVLNHISWLDMFVIGAIHPPTFIAKSEIRGWPLIGPLVTGVGTLYIERGKRAGALRARQEIAEAIERGVLIAFFPEGTTTYGRSLGRFHPALFQPALDVAATLQPVALRYVDDAGMHTDAAAYAGESSFMESIWTIASTRSIVAEMRLLEPLSAIGQTRRSLAENAETLIAAALGVPAPQRISRSGHPRTEPDTGAGPPDELR